MRPIGANPFSYYFHSNHPAATGNFMNLAIRAHDLGVKGETDILDRLNAYGTGGVQLVCYKSFADIPHAPGGITEERAAEIGGAFIKAGKRVELIGAYFNPVHSNPLKREAGIAVFKDYIKNGKALKCDIIGSETGSYNDDKWTYHPKNRTEEALQTVVGTFKDLCREAGRFGVNVGIEGASGHVCYDVKTLKRAVDEIAVKNLRVIFDLYNFLDEANAEKYLDILHEGIGTFGENIRCFHIKDCKFTKGGPVQCAVGKGELDFRAICKAIKRHNPDAVLILEGTTGGDIPGSIRFINEKWEGATLL